MDHHARVLQQRIQVAAVGGGGHQAQRTGCDVNSMKSRKPTPTSPITPSTRASIASGRLRGSQRDRERPAREHQHPEQQRALVRAPRGGDAVVERQLRVRIASRRSTRRNRWSRSDYARQPNAIATSSELRARGGRGERHPARRRGGARRRAAACLRERRRAARGSARNGRARESWALSVVASACSACSIAFVLLRLASTRGGGFGRHVVLVVLREHFGRVEHAVGSERALRDHALAFLEEVGKEAACRRPARVCAVSVTMKRTVSRSGTRLRLPASTSPPMRNGAALRRLVRSDLRRREEEHEIRLERVQHERGRDAEHDDAGADPQRSGDGAPSSAPSVARSHPARRAATMRAARRSAHAASTTIASAVTPYAPQT